MRLHLTNYNKEIQSKITLFPGDYVLDIGSNDGTSLRCYPDFINKVGIDPTGHQFKHLYSGLTLIPKYFTKENVSHLNVKFKVVSSIAMFYDLPDPVKFAEDIFGILDDEGIWTLEQSYLLMMIESKSFDTICHEHLEYYAVKQIKLIADLAGFKIIDLSLNESNGGSFRTYMAKKNSSYPECKEVINTFLKKETLAGLGCNQTYIDFMEQCSGEVEKLKEFVKNLIINKKRVYVYGASTKGNTFLQYAQLNNQQIPYAVERNLDKVGMMTPGTHIEIISEETMRQNPPEFLLVLPWHFKTEIIEREQKYLENGGQLIFALPTFTIVGKKKC